MKLKKFTFSKIDPVYGGVISFATKDISININDRYIAASLIELVRGILTSWNDEKQVVQITFEQEARWYDLLLINYPPGDILKIEIYQDTLWDFFDEVNYTIPDPIYSEFTDHHSFAFLISQEITRQGAEVFKNPEYPYPETELKLLHRMMIG